MPIDPFASSRRSPAWDAVAMCYVTSLAVVMLNLAPELEQQLRAELSYEPTRVGTFFVVELGALGAASIPFTWAAKRLGHMGLARVALLLWVAGNALSIPALPSFAGMLASRFVAGLGAGLLMVLGMKAAAAARRPDRMFALMVCAQLASGAALLAVLPLLTAAGGGLKAVFVVNLLLAMPLPWILRSLGRAQPAAPRPDDRPEANRWNWRGNAVLLVAAVTLFNVATGGLWTFIGEFAGLAAVSSTRLASVLSLATLTGIAATALAGCVGRRGSRTAWLLCGLLGIATGTTLLHRSDQEAGFALGCLLVSLGWNFSVPCLLSLCADRDDGVGLMPAVNSAFAAGLAIGPTIAAWAFEMNGAGGLLNFVLVALGAASALLVAATRGETEAHSSS